MIWTFSTSWNERIADPNVPKGYRLIQFGRVFNFNDEATAKFAHRRALGEDIPHGASDHEVSELRRIDTGNRRTSAA